MVFVATLQITVVDVEVVPPSLNVRSIPTCPITSGWSWLAKIIIINTYLQSYGTNEFRGTLFILATQAA